MALLFDRVAAGLVDTLPDVLYPGEPQRSLRSSQVIVADNVTEFFFAGTPQEIWDLRVDFPNLAPPFRECWIETKRPSKILSEVSGESTSKYLPKSWAALMVSDDNPHPERDSLWRWRVNAMLWAVAPKASAPTGAAGPLGGLAFFTNKEGRIVDVGHKSISTVISFRTETGPYYLGGTAESHSHMVRFLMDPLLLAVCFMHCKNVKKQLVTPPSLMDKKWTKRHKRPLVRYHILDIDPMKEVLEGEGEHRGNGLRKALHICRGHFATYTAEAPLFGRMTGTFWRPQHIRGSLSEGLVMKDYRIKAPAEKEKTG